MKKTIGLLKIDHHGAVIYQLGGIDEKILNTNIPYDPEKIHWHLHNKKVNDGKNNNEDIHFFKEIISELNNFSGLVIASHGNGKANEGNLFKKFLETHHKGIFNMIVSSIETDEHETENEMLAKVDHNALLTHLRK